MEQDEYKRYLSSLKTLLVWGSILLSVFFVGRFVWQYVTTGTLTVTTTSKTAKITISSAATPSASAKVVKRGTGSITTNLRTGDYLVAVENGRPGTSKLVHVGGLSHTSVNVNLPKPLAVEPVLYMGVKDVAVDNSRMTYVVNGVLVGVNYLTNNNQVSTVSGSQPIGSVTWADAEYGVGQDAAGKLYVIDGNTTRSLQSPLSSLSNVSGTVYAVAPNRTIYIGLGSYVYRGTEQGGFQQVYDRFSSGDSLVASNKAVMILSPGMHQSRSSATVIDTSGKEITKNFSTALGGWTQWSHSGKYIVMTVGAQPILFDTSLTQISNIAQAANTYHGVSQAAVINNGSWLDDNTLFYSYGGQLWSYNVSQQTSNLVATMPGQEVILEVAISSDGSYVYLTDSGSDALDPAVVRRVGLHNQPIANTVLALQNVMPINDGSFVIGLRNFKGTPNVFVTVTAEADPNDALQQAKDTVQNIIGDNANVTYTVESGADY